MPPCRSRSPCPYPRWSGTASGCGTPRESAWRPLAPSRFGLGWIVRRLTRRPDPARTVHMSRVAQAAAALGAVMRSRNLRRVELAWGASIASEWAHFVALGVFAYAAGGTAAVGVAGLARLLPAATV